MLSSASIEVCHLSAHCIFVLFLWFLCVSFVPSFCSVLYYVHMCYVCVIAQDIITSAGDVPTLQLSRFPAPASDAAVLLACLPRTRQATYQSCLSKGLEHVQSQPPRLPEALAQFKLARYLSLGFDAWCEADYYLRKWDPDQESPSLNEWQRILRTQGHTYFGPSW